MRWAGQRGGCWQQAMRRWTANCRKSTTCASRQNIQMEVEKHRSALGQCLSAFSACFPVAFLEAEFNANNKLSVLAKSRDQSVQVQEMLQNLSQHIPILDKLLLDIEQSAAKRSEDGEGIWIDQSILTGHSRD